MVGTERGRRWLGQVWHGLSRDIRGILAPVTPLAAPPPGMYTYCLTSEGGSGAYTCASSRMAVASCLWMSPM